MVRDHTFRRNSSTWTATVPTSSGILSSRQPLIEEMNSATVKPSSSLNSFRKIFMFSILKFYKIDDHQRLDSTSYVYPWNDQHHTIKIVSMMPYYFFNYKRPQSLKKVPTKPREALMNWISRIEVECDQFWSAVG